MDHFLFFLCVASTTSSFEDTDEGANEGVDGDEEYNNKNTVINEHSSIGSHKFIAAGVLVTQLCFEPFAPVVGHV